MDIRRLVDDAEGPVWETVLQKHKNGYVPPGVIEWSPGPPPVEYLDSGEQPHYVGTGLDKALTVRGATGLDLRKQSRTPLDSHQQGSTMTSGDLSADDPFCNILLLTDRRMLLFVGKAHGDIVTEFGYDEQAQSDGERISIDSNNRVISADGLKYRIRCWPPNPTAAIQFLEKQFTSQPGRQKSDNGTDHQISVSSVDEEDIIQAAIRRVRSKKTPSEKQNQDTAQQSYGKRVAEQIEAFIDTELNGGEEISSADKELLHRWLDIYARWESLRTIKETPRTSVSTSNLKGIGQGLSENLRHEGYETLQDIRRVSAAELAEVKGVGTETAQRIQRHACFRSLDQILDIGPGSEARLQRNGYRHSADLSAASLAELTEIEGLGDTRAEKIQSRAASWLPRHDYAIPPVIKQCLLPFDDIEDAERQIDQLEEILLHPDCGRLIALLERVESLPTTESEIDEVILDSCLHSRGQSESDGILDERWLDIGERVVELETDRRERSVPVEVSSKFNQADFPELSVSPTEVMTSTLSEAEEQVTDIERKAAARTRFVTIVTQAADVVETLGQLHVEGVERLQSAISVQIAYAHGILTAEGGEDELANIGRFVSVSNDAIETARNHPEYPFDELIVTLANRGEDEELDMSVIADIEEVVTVACDAIARLDTLEFDHPAIDRDSWTESIKLALEEQYPPAIQPIKKQLDRLRGGLWKEQNLHMYDWQEFERLIGHLYHDEGSEIEVTQSNADLGVDIWANDEKERIAIQVKQFQKGGTVGRETLQKLVSTLAKGDADRAVVVTSGEFAHTARRYAEDFGDGLELIGPDELIQRLSESSIPPREGGD